MNKEELNRYIQIISPMQEDIVKTCIIDPELEKLDTKTKKIITNTGASTLFEFILLSVSNPAHFRSLGIKTQQIISEYLKKYGVKTEEISDDLEDYLNKNDYSFVRDLCKTEGCPRKITLYNLYSLYLQYRQILMNKRTLFTHKNYHLEYYYNIPREYLRNMTTDYLKIELERDYQRLENMLNSIVNQIKEKNPKFALNYALNEICRRRDILTKLNETLEERERLIDEREMIDRQINGIKGRGYVKH